MWRDGLGRMTSGLLMGVVLAAAHTQSKEETIRRSSYNASSTDTLIIALGMVFVAVGTGSFVAFVLVSAARRPHDETSAQAPAVDVDDMPLLSDVDMYPLESRHSDVESRMQYPVHHQHPHLVRRETPLLERCGSSTVSDYQMGDEATTELKPLTFSVESQRFNVQMRSSHQPPHANSR
ncbi:Aste57867_23432 [Aphanomyces stellatus]|uniref:Aste57867_23432 protein n=1 Tax=Aphanomyces stellatus TaxID=120398 RepID=A0A485LMM4_9STRA|nr:hypothetical protein As57867_023361 [Aphanomyces stellatus]VFU00078.1 Aste57867_23432 [Aphanomyces stellatus]